MNPGKLDEQSMVLTPGLLTIGRTRDNTIVCEDKSLSRRHAQLENDGTRVRVVDLQSKNGVFFEGQRVPSCTLLEGDSFRCGDVTFLLEGATARNTTLSAAIRTLPSPLALDNRPGKSGPKLGAAVNIDDHRYKEKLLALIRAGELLVGDLALEGVLDQLIVLAVQVLDVDRIALLTLDEATLEMVPKVQRTFAGVALRPYSKRVVDWVMDHGSPGAFADVSKDKTLPGDVREDDQIRGAMAVPVNPGGGAVGVLYADSVSRPNAFFPEDIALFRAFANIAAVAMENDALRRRSGSGADAEDRTGVPG